MLTPIGGASTTHRASANPSIPTQAGPGDVFVQGEREGLANSADPASDGTAGSVANHGGQRCHQTGGSTDAAATVTPPPITLLALPDATPDPPPITLLALPDDSPSGGQKPGLTAPDPAPHGQDPGFIGPAPRGQEPEPVSLQGRTREELMDLADRHPDPVAARLARLGLVGVKSEGLLDSRALSEGATRASLSQLWQAWHYPQNHFEHFDGQALEHMARLPAGAPEQNEATRLFTFLARDRGPLAARAAQQLQTWWAEGRLRVQGPDGPALPGSLDLTQLPADTRVRDGVVLLRAKNPITPSGDPSILSPAEVERLELGRRDIQDLPRITQWLARAREVPELKQELEPALPVLRTVVSRREELGWTSSARERPLWEYLEQLLATFPQVADREFLHQELQPMIRTHGLGLRDFGETPGARVLKAFLAEAPELRAEAVAPFFEGRSLRMDPNTRDGIDFALGAGHVPTREQAAWLSSWLLLLPGDNTMGHDDGWNAALEGLCRVPPEQIDDMTLPDSEGQVRPLRLALLDRLLDQPDRDVVSYLSIPESPPVRHLHHLLDHREVRKELERRVATGFTTIDALSRADQAALTLAMTTSGNEWVAPLIPGELTRTQDHHQLSALVDHYRGRVIQNATREIVAGEGPPVLERCEQLERILDAGFDSYRRTTLALRFWQPAAASLLQSMGEQGLREWLAPMRTRFVEALDAAGPRLQLSDPQMLEARRLLAASTLLPELRRELCDRLEPWMSGDAGVEAHSLMAPLREEVFERNLDRLRAGSTDPVDGAKLAGHALRVAHNSTDGKLHRRCPEAETAWAEGVLRAGPDWARSLVEPGVGKTATRDHFCFLGEVFKRPIPPEDGRQVARIFQLLEEPRAARDAVRRYAEQRESGLTPEAAAQAALGALVLATQAANTSGVTLEAAQVTVGGVRLRRRAVRPED